MERDIQHHAEIILSGQADGIGTWQSVFHVANTGKTKKLPNLENRSRPRKLILSRKRLRNIVLYYFRTLPAVTGGCGIYDHIT